MSRFGSDNFHWGVSTWCPVCGTKYQLGLTRCPDCDVALLVLEPEPLEPLPSPRTVGVPTLASSAVLVFDFRGDHSVRDESGALLGSCKLERVDLWQAVQVGYVCRDHTETVAWMVVVVKAYLEKTYYAVYGPDRAFIGSVDHPYLYVDVEAFAELGKYGIRDLQGREIARTLPFRERFSSRRQVEVRYSTSLEGPRHDIVAATACVREMEAAEAWD